ncbi:MAG: TetR/AcrR family transcriptional regulator [Firmicutes bacterium]|nr:TetR/AcrR family transcriptional regulator [Bacillota bacterium]
MVKKTDIRIIRSRAAIRHAFLELLKERDYHSITISDIAQRAMINRKTFYFHYDTKNDLYDEIITDTLNVFSSMHIIEKLRKSDKKSQSDILLELLNKVITVKDECIILLDNDSGNVFNRRLKQLLYRALITESLVSDSAKSDPAFFDLLTDVYFSTFTRVLKWWLVGDNNDPTAFLDMIKMLFSSRPLEILGLKEDVLG